MDNYYADIVAENAARSTALTGKTEITVPVTDLIVMYDALNKAISGSDDDPEYMEVAGKIWDKYFKALWTKP